MNNIFNNLRQDDLQCQGLQILQDPNQYCFSSDAILLANFIRAKKGDTLVDFGCGSGVITLLASKKTNATTIYGLEKQNSMSELAQHNVILNNLQSTIHIINDDIANSTQIFGKESVNVVVCNPPYFVQDSGIQKDNSALALSRHESTCTLDDIVQQASNILKWGGKIYMVHKSERLAEVLTSMTNHKLTPKVVTLIYPKADRQTDVFIVEGKKCAKAGIKIDSLIVYNNDGTMTEKASQLYNKHN